MTVIRTFRNKSFLFFWLYMCFCLCERKDTKIQVVCIVLVHSWMLWTSIPSEREFGGKVWGCLVREGGTKDLQRCFALLVKSSKHLLDCFTLFSSSPLFLCCPEMNYLIFEFQVFGQPLLVIHFLTGCVLCFSCCAVVVELLSCVQLFATPWTAAPQASLSFIISQSLLKLMSIESVMPSNHLILCCPLLILPSICPSIRVFSNVSALCIRWPKYWSFSFSISPSNKYSGLISLGLPGLNSLLSKRLSRVFSKPQFKRITSSALSLVYGPTLIHT